MATVYDIHAGRNSLSHDPAAAADACRIIFGDRPWQLVRINPNDPEDVADVVIPAGDTAALAHWLDGDARQQSVFFAHAHRKAGSIRRKKADIEGATWLAADVDPDKLADLQAERDRILSLLQIPPAGVPDPTVIIDSGRGYVGLWRLDERCSPADAEACNRWLRDELGADPVTFDVSRILRLPGTVNFKPEAAGRRARIVDHQPMRIYASDRFGRVCARQADVSDPTPMIELDRDDAIAAAISIARTASPAIEGSGGRTAAFSLGMRLKRAGLSAEMAQDIALAIYDPRCSPPDPEWTCERIERGWHDGEGRPGCDHPLVRAKQDLAGIEIAQTSADLQISDRSRVRFLSDADASLRPSWLVKGWLPTEGVALLAGQSRIGKTFVSLELAGALATGGSFFGRPVREQVGALILAAEGGGTISPRLDALRVHRLGGLDPAKLPIAWADISDANEIGAAVAAAADEMQRRFGLRLGIVVVDTLSATFGVDENDAQLATAAMKALGKLALDARLLVVAVAHYGKSDGAGVRGSSAWTASADIILAATGEISEITGQVKDRKLALTKSRFSETGPIADFELRSVNVGVDEDGDPISAAIVRPVSVAANDPHLMLYMDGLAGLMLAAGEATPDGRKGVSRELLRQHCYNDWTDSNSAARKKRFGRIEERLVAGKQIEKAFGTGGVELVVPAPPINPASLF
jgi:hypothetical protein